MDAMNQDEELVENSSNGKLSSAGSRTKNEHSFQKLIEKLTFP